MQQARTLRRKPFVDGAIGDRHVADLGHRGEFLQAGMRVLLEAKHQHLHQVGSTELALTHNTARLSP